MQVDTNQVKTYGGDVKYRSHSLNKTERDPISNTLCPYPSQDKKNNQIKSMITQTQFLTLQQITKQKKSAQTRQNDLIETYTSKVIIISPFALKEDTLLS